MDLWDTLPHASTQCEPSSVSEAAQQPLFQISPKLVSISTELSPLYFPLLLLKALSHYAGPQLISCWFKKLTSLTRRHLKQYVTLTTTLCSPCRTRRQIQDMILFFSSHQWVQSISPQRISQGYNPILNLLLFERMQHDLTCLGYQVSPLLCFHSVQELGISGSGSYSS